MGNPAAVIARQTVAKATALGATAPSRAPVIRAPLALRARPGKVGRAPSVAPGPHSAMGAPRPAYTKSRPHVPAASSVAARGPSSSPPPPPRPLLRLLLFFFFFLSVFDPDVAQAASSPPERRTSCRQNHLWGPAGIRERERRESSQLGRRRPGLRAPGEGKHARTGAAAGAKKNARAGAHRRAPRPLRPCPELTDERQVPSGPRLTAWRLVPSGTALTAERPVSSGPSFTNLRRVPLDPAPARARSRVRGTRAPTTRRRGHGDTRRAGLRALLRPVSPPSGLGGGPGRLLTAPRPTAKYPQPSPPEFRTAHYRPRGPVQAWAPALRLWSLLC